MHCKHSVGTRHTYIQAWITHISQGLNIYIHIYTIFTHPLFLLVKYSYTSTMSYCAITDMTTRIKYQRESMNYYQKAYNLLKNDYRSCHLSPCDPTLERLIERLPGLLRLFHFPVESVDKVKFNLKVYCWLVNSFMSYEWRCKIWILLYWEIAFFV